MVVSKVVLRLFILMFAMGSLMLVMTFTFLDKVKLQWVISAIYKQLFIWELYFN